MLVLTRWVDESVMVGDDVKVIIVSIQGDKVKLGFEAPDDVKIWREEIYKEKGLENDNATDNTDN